jgi:rubrerythrin
MAAVFGLKVNRAAAADLLSLCPWREVLHGQDCDSQKLCVASSRLSELASEVHGFFWSVSMTERTKNNLRAAMESDALDAAKYSRFAARARMDDDWELAEVFQDVADSDRTEQFAREADLQGLVRSSPDNLRNAIDEQRKEVSRFVQFAREAKEDGDLEAAALFEKISSDKAEQLTRLEAALEEMGIHSSIQEVTA